MKRFALCSLMCLGLTANVTKGFAQINADAMGGRAFEGAQWVLATQAAKAVAQVGARAAAGDGPLGDKIRDRQHLEGDLDAARKLLAASISTDPDTARRAQNDITRLSTSLDQIDQDIRDSFPEYADFANPQPLDYDTLRQNLRDGEALVLFLSGGAATYVWAISKTGAAWHRAEITAAHLSEMVRNLRRDLDPNGPARSAAALGDSPRALTFDLDTAHQLYLQLFAPVMDVLKDASHVFVVKDGALASLPLSVLVSDPPANPADLQSVAWLAHKFAFTTLPAVSSLASIRANTQARSDTTLAAASFVGFGDPVFGRDATPATIQVASRSMDTFFVGTGSRLEAIRALAPLPGTARELRRIAQVFPEGQAIIRLGDQATEATVKSLDLSATSIISFATHGLVTGDITGLAEPALALTPPETATAQDDGLLTASEASMLNLNADWVILSACNTAAGDGTPGAEGLSGLTRAFLFAGARSLLVSHWPVRDDVAATLTSQTLRRLAETPDLGRSEALRLAILDVIGDRSDPSLAHPSAWAPFVVVGEGGALSH